MSDLFAKLLAESKEYQAKKKNKSKTGKTYSESKKRRVNRTKNSLLVKESINRKHDKIIESSLKPEFIEVLVHTEQCGRCRIKTRRVVYYHVWSKATKGEHLDPWRMTQEINSHQMLELNLIDLPLRRIERNRTIPACPSCIDKLTEKNPWKG